MIKLEVKLKEEEAATYNHNFFYLIALLTFKVLQLYDFGLPLNF